MKSKPLFKTPPYPNKIYYSESTWDRAQLLPIKTVTTKIAAHRGLSQFEWCEGLYSSKSIGKSDRSDPEVKQYFDNLKNIYQSFVICNGNFGQYLTAREAIEINTIVAGYAGEIIYIPVKDLGKATQNPLKKDVYINSLFSQTFIDELSKTKEQSELPCVSGKKKGNHAALLQFAPEEAQVADSFLDETQRQQVVKANTTLLTTDFDGYPFSYIKTISRIQPGDELVFDYGEIFLEDLATPLYLYDKNQKIIGDAKIYLNKSKKIAELKQAIKVVRNDPDGKIAEINTIFSIILGTHQKILTELSPSELEFLQSKKFLLFAKFIDTLKNFENEKAAAAAYPVSGNDRALYALIPLAEHERDKWLRRNSKYVGFFQNTSSKEEEKDFPNSGLVSEARYQTELEKVDQESMEIFTKLISMNNKTMHDIFCLNELAYYFAIRKQACSAKDEVKSIDWCWYAATAFFAANNYPDAVPHLAEFIAVSTNSLQRMQEQDLQELQKKIAEAEIKLYECTCFNDHQLIGALLIEEENNVVEEKNKKPFSEKFVTNFHQICSNTQAYAEHWYKFSPQCLFFLCNLSYILASTCTRIAMRNPQEKVDDLIDKHAFFLKYCGMAIKMLSDQPDLTKNPLLPILRDKIIHQYFSATEEFLAKAGNTDELKITYLKNCLELMDFFDLHSSNRLRRNEVEEKLADLAGYENSGYNFCTIT